MGKKANPAVIGLFVVAAVALTVAGVLVFGRGEFLKEKLSWVSYFPGAVDGLQVGASVVFKGVKVGQVTDIKVMVDPRGDVVRIPVSWDLETDRFALMGMSEAERAEFHAVQKERRPIAQVLIKRGLRAQLQMQSFVTGQKFVALDFFPDTPINLVGDDREEKVPEFPTVESSTERLTKTLEELPIKELIENASQMFHDIDRLVKSPELLASIRSIGDASREIRTLARNVDSQVVPATHATLEKAQGAFSSIEGVAAPGSPVRYELVNALKEFAAAARSMRVLADYLERHPEALVQGKGGPGGNRR